MKFALIRKIFFIYIFSSAIKFLSFFTRNVGIVVSLIVFIAISAYLLYFTQYGYHGVLKASIASVVSDLWRYIRSIASGYQNFDIKQWLIAVLIFAVPSYIISRSSFRVLLIPIKVIGYSILNVLKYLRNLYLKNTQKMVNNFKNGAVKPAKQKLPEKKFSTIKKNLRN